MTAFVGRHWPTALALSVLALGMAVEINLARDVGAPFPGVLTFRNHLHNVWQVEPSTPSWWPALSGGTLRYDDVLVAVDGVPYGPAAREQFEAAGREGRTSVRLQLRRGNATVDTELPLRRFTVANLLDVTLPECINALGLWFLAVVVLRARPGAPANRVFAATFALAALGSWTVMPSIFVDAGGVTRALQLVWVLTFCIMGSTFVHLILLVPEPVHGIPRSFLRGLYGYAAAISLTYVTAMLLVWRDPMAPAAVRLTAMANAVHHAFLVAGCVLCAGRLLWLATRRNRSRRLRRQVAVLLVGLSLCLPYVAIQLLRSLGTYGTHFWTGLDLRCMQLPLPICMAFLILRYQTFRKARPAIGGVLILGTSALLASVGAWLMRRLDPRWNEVTFSPFLALLAVGFLASLAWSTETSWRQSLARLFDWHHRSYAAARQFGQDVVSRDDLRQTPAAIVRALLARMELERAALWLWEERSGVFALAAHAGAWPQAAVERIAVAALPGAEPPMRLAAPDVPDWLLPLRQPDGVEVVAMLCASGRPIGLLGLGKRWDEEIFDERDLDIVELIAQQAALFLLTAAQIDQLQRVPHQIAETQERERFRIAQELHDTVQQFLGRLPFYLEVSRKAARHDPGETESILADCMADVESAAQTVREIRADLAPLQLERSLSEPLRRLAAHFRSRTRIAGDVAIEGEVEAALGLEARHALYRVVQQALDNVSAHAEARVVEIAVRRDADRVAFAVKDDGRGFSDEHRARAAENGRFGLTSMRARITSLGGELQIESMPGAGTCVRGWLPRQADGRVQGGETRARTTTE
jgi:signal transduction histidine kinase